MRKRDNPKYISSAKFINYCNEKNIAISRIDHSKKKVINLSAEELIEEYDCFLTMNDCLDSLRHRICNVLTSHVPFDKDTGELYPDTRFVSPERLADELIKLLDDENVSRILELYYKSRCGDGEL